MLKREEYILKTIIIGSASVGKSSLVHHYVFGEYSGNLNQTTGVEYSSKNTTHQGKQIKLQIWDTAGQERFKSITKTYYRGAKGALLVFDLTSRASFIQCKEWFSLANEVCGEGLGCVLIGNKKDLESLRAVSLQEIAEFAESFNLLYVETSCLTGENVRHSFETMIDLVFNKIDANLINKDDLIKKWVNENVSIVQPKKHQKLCPC